MKKIKLCEPDIGKKEIRTVTRAIKDHMVSSGAPTVRKFEEAFAKKYGASHAIAVNSGGSALFLAVKALGIGPGDEVIVPTFTMLATAAAVSYCNATPVFVDSEAHSPNIDPKQIESKITTHTKAIVVAHLFGIACDMAPIMRIAKKHKLPVIEDVAEAHLGSYRGELLGTIGDFGCFSFYASKTMTTGEGGMIITHRTKEADLIRRLREYDIAPSRPYVHEMVAWNLRMSALEAALGLAQLSRLEELKRKRNAVAAYYTKSLRDIAGIEFFDPPRNSNISTWLYTILVPRRDALVAHLAVHGIESKRAFVPMHQLTPYLTAKGKFKNAEYFGGRAISLPSASMLTAREQDVVIGAIRNFFLTEA